MDGAEVIQTPVDDCEDMMQEVLIKLPVKVLIRFKQVSKRWLERITGPDLSKKQEDSSAVFLLRTFTDYPRFITSISIDQHQENNYTSSIQYENLHLPYLEASKSLPGLDYWAPPMFAVGLGLYCIFKFGSQEVALWNPTTREIKVLPSPPFPDQDDRGHLFGFGHAEIKDGRLSYKVGIIGAQDTWPNSVPLYLYSSASDSWKLLTSHIGYGRNSHGDGVNLKGILHLFSWPVMTLPYIITFDYASEAFGTMEMPDFSYRNLFPYKSRLTLYDDTICLFLYRPKMCEAQLVFFDVWVMREYGVKESWCKECTVGPFNTHISVLGYWKSLGGILLLEDDGRRTRLFLYKCESSELMDLFVGSSDSEVMNAYEHVESLVSIGGTPDQIRVQKFSPGHDSRSSLK